MPLIVEDGTGVEDVETYCTVAHFKTYCNGLGLAITGVVDERIEQLLRQAGEYMQGMYRGAWAYEVFGVVDEKVPREVKNACARLAHKAIAGPLLRDVKPTATKIKVGPIEKEVDPNASPYVQYPDVDRMLAPYLVAHNPYSVKLERN